MGGCHGDAAQAFQPAVSCAKGSRAHLHVAGEARDTATAAPVTGDAPVAS